MVHSLSALTQAATSALQRHPRRVMGAVGTLLLTTGVTAFGIAPLAPDAADLPISDYESLAAIHVVDRLRSMRPDELDLVRRFEVAHRNRRTILAKIDQLQAR